MKFQRVSLPDVQVSATQNTAIQLFCHINCNGSNVHSKLRVLHVTVGNATSCLILFYIFAVWRSLFCLRIIVSSSDCNRQLGNKDHETTKWRITMNIYCGNGGLVPPTITLSDGWSAVPLPVKTSGGTQYDSGWVPEPVWTYWKGKQISLPYWKSNHISTVVQPVA